VIAKKSRWSDPPVIIAALAVLNGGYWQYRAFGAADQKAEAELTRKVDRLEAIISDRLPEINERLRRIEDRPR